MVRAPDCGSGGCGFESRHPPQSAQSQQLATRNEQTVASDERSAIQEAQPLRSYDPEVVMVALGLLVALENAQLAAGLLIAIILMGALWGPYLYKEIRRGKAKVGPHAPLGAGDTHPGRRGDP